MFKVIPTPEELNETFGAGNMVAYIGIEFTEAGPDYLSARMPVDERTRQAFGILHGGASVVLAETIGSVAANLCVDHAEAYCVGLDINSNHIRATQDGYVIGTARPLHLGGRTQVWEIRIEDEAGRLTNISRLTMAVIRRSEGRQPVRRTVAPGQEAIEHE